MGCGSSKSRPKQLNQSSNEFDEQNGSISKHLSDRDIHLVRDSWSLIQDNMLEVGLEIFSNFFRTAENEILRLFPKVIQTEDGGVTLGVDEQMMKGHALFVMQGLDTIVSYIDQPTKLQRYLEYLGKKHYSNNVKMNMLERLWPHIDMSFSATLKDVYLSEVRTAWRIMIEYAIGEMSNAMTAEITNKSAHINGNGINTQT